MGEGAEDRVGMIVTLANLPAHPESVPINMLVKVEGTPLAGADALDPIDFVRTIAVARITMPKSVARPSVGGGGKRLGRARRRVSSPAPTLFSLSMTPPPPPP